MKRVILNKKFQKEIFEILLSRFSRHALTKKLEISSPSIYQMKAGKIESIDIRKFQIIKALLQLSDEDIKKNTLKIISEKDILKGLEIGRKLRNEQLKKWKSEIPQLKEITEANSLNVGFWFEKYVKLTNFGVRRVAYKKTKNKIIIHLKTHSTTTGQKQIYKVILPNSILLDDDFVYFFGLWCGDRAGGGRVGIVNKQHELLLFTKGYLEKLHQNIECMLLKNTNVENSPPELPFKVDKVQIVKNMAGTYVPIIFSTNGFLKSFFDYLDENLDEFLSMLPNNNVFFAGLFDAEGNVFLEDSCFRWACQDTRKVEIYKKYLSYHNLFKRYDGGNLVTNNAESFLLKIFPHIKHKKKINSINLLFFNKGSLDNHFKKILICIHDNPWKTSKELVKLMDKKKVYSQLKFLCRKGYAKTEGYPMKFYTTEKGLNELKEVVM